jgi:glycolate oxidase iron-sulfur subunit
MTTSSPARLGSPEFHTVIDRCIHCGLCLNACPTYRVFRTEMDGPRGRIDLIRAAADGRIEVGEVFSRHLELCLQCRSCESACPSGVEYGSLVGAAAAAIHASRPPGPLGRLVRRLLLQYLIPFPWRLRLLARMLALYQASGLARLVRPLLPRNLARLEALLPPTRFARQPLPETIPAAGPARGRVIFFHGCLQDAFLEQVNLATIRVLTRNGFEVRVPRGQTCCAALPAHLGEEEVSRALARRNIEACGADASEPIVNNAGGCGAMLKEYGRLLAGDAKYEEPARRFSARVRDVSEFLAERGIVPPPQSVATRAVYVDSCHLRHAQHVHAQPRQILRSIPGLELAELEHPEQCCGSAGTYNVLHVEVADRVSEAKMADILATGAETIVSANTGCHLQLRRAVAEAGLNKRVAHVMELLDQAYGGPDGQ